MSYCTKCKGELPDGARFCTYCGSPVLQRSAPDPGMRPPGAGSRTYTTGRATADRNVIRIDKAGRMVKGLICIPIALALITVFLVFFEIDPARLGDYAAIVAGNIYNMGIFQEAAPLLGRIAVYGLALMIILSAYMLPARLSKTIYRTCTLGDKFKVTIAGYYFIALLIYLKTEIIDKGIVGKTFSLLFRVHGVDRLKVLIAFVILLAAILIAAGFIAWSFGVLSHVVVSNLKVNGPLLGTVAAAYELLNSVFTTALVLCVFSFGVAVILFPFLIMGACTYGRRVAYDEYGNLYYVY